MNGISAYFLEASHKMIATHKAFFGKAFDRQFFTQVFIYILHHRFNLRVGFITDMLIVIKASVEKYKQIYDITIADKLFTRKIHPLLVAKGFTDFRNRESCLGIDSQNIRLFGFGLFKAFRQIEAIGKFFQKLFRNPDDDPFVAL